MWTEFITERWWLIVSLWNCSWAVSQTQVEYSKGFFSWVRVLLKIHEGTCRHGGRLYGWSLPKWMMRRLGLFFQQFIKKGRTGHGCRYKHYEDRFWFNSCSAQLTCISIHSRHCKQLLGQRLNLKCCLWWWLPMLCRRSNAVIYLWVSEWHVETVI